ncbi:MAG: cold shock protein [Acidimicrobiaceae bacterium]|jgi:cold shock CspA family protein
MTGTVSSFDDAAGLGMITSDDGSEFAFHCTAIAGGSRTIDVNTAVDFEPRPARHGTWEAGSVTPQIR